MIATCSLLGLCLGKDIHWVSLVQDVTFSDASQSSSEYVARFSTRLASLNGVEDAAVGVLQN